MSDTVQAKLELVGGATLMSTPLWVSLLHETNLIASTIAAICGAIVGLHAVYRLYCRHCDEKKGRG